MPHMNYMCIYMSLFMENTFEMLISTLCAEKKISIGPSYFFRVFVMNLVFLSKLVLIWIVHTHTKKTCNSTFLRNFDFRMSLYQKLDSCLFYQYNFVVNFDWLGVPIFNPSSNFWQQRLCFSVEIILWNLCWERERRYKQKDISRRDIYFTFGWLN